MDNRIKDTIVVKITKAQKPIPIYLLSNGKIMVDESIIPYLKESVKTKIKPQIIIDENTDEVESYSLREVLEKLPHFILEDITKYLILEKFNVKEEPLKERNLSEFDKNILKAMKYNPKEEE